MQPLKVMGLDGPAYEGTWWSVTEGGTDLEMYETRQKAVSKARSIARPGQEIKVVSTTGKVEVIREGDESARTQHGGGYGGGGLFGAGQVDDGGGLFGEDDWF